MPTLAERVEELRRLVGARAAGFWRLEGDRLIQAAFAPGPELSAEAAGPFARASRSVGLDQADLGIVRAATTGAPAISVAAELPAGSGSGRWLRAFGADRSVALPLTDDAGRVVAVVSVAVPEGAPDDSTLLAELRRLARALALG